MTVSNAIGIAMFVTAIVIGLALLVAEWRRRRADRHRRAERDRIEREGRAILKILERSHPADGGHPPPPPLPPLRPPKGR